MTDASSVDGRLVAGDGDAWSAGATIEIWEPGWPRETFPADRPVASRDDHTAGDAAITDHLLATTTTDDDGTFTALAPEFDVAASERSADVVLRIFDEDDELLDTVTVESFDPDAPLVLTVESSGSGGAWKRPAAATGGLAMAAAALSLYVLGGEDGGSASAMPGDPTEQDHPPQIDSPDRSGHEVRRTADQGRFLYTGEDPVQTGVEEDAIDDAAATILRGRATTPEGDPLAGVTVGIQGYPEFGRTETRDTGLFDMVVNGGRQYVVSAQKEGRLPVQRKREVPRSNHVWVDDIALVTADERSTTIENGASTGQLHRASETNDEAGQRRTRVYFPPNTAASTGNDGAGIPPELEVRATEYTVGDRGPQSMPGELPPVTGYTYAVELTAEATGSVGADDGSGRSTAGGGSGSRNGSTGRGDNGLTRPLLADAMGDVQFDRQVALHLENFLGFPVGGVAPAGVLGREDASWEPMDDGRVIEVLGIQNGTASLDVSGSGQPATRSSLRELGITDDEREQIASEFSSGDTIWRVRLEHFTPCDINWPTEPDNDEKPGDGGEDGEGEC